MGVTVVVEVGGIVVEDVTSLTSESSAELFAAKAAPPVARIPTNETVVTKDVFMSLTVWGTHLRQVQRTSKICPRYIHCLKN